MTTLVRWPADQVRHVMAYRTDVLQAYDGTEHRAQLLGKPRDIYELGIALDDDQIRQVQAWLHTDPAGAYEIPLRHERLLATVSGTTVTVGTTTLSDWAAVDGRVLVENIHDPDNYYTAAIDAVGATTLTLDASPPGAMSFPTGSIAVSPLVSVYLENGQALGRQRINEGRWSLNGRAIAPRASFGTGAAALTTLDSLPILTRRSVHEGLAQENFVGDAEIIDAGGAIATDWPRTVAGIKRALEFQIDSTDAERQWWKLFLHTLKGRQKPFLLPTWRHDLTAASNPAGTELIVEGPPTTDATDYVNDWWPSLAHRRLQIIATNGTIYYRTVTAAVDNADGTHSLTIATLTATVERISFLETCRLDSDEIAIEYHGPDLGSLQLAALVVAQ